MCTQYISHSIPHHTERVSGHHTKSTTPFIPSCHPSIQLAIRISHTRINGSQSRSQAEAVIKLTAVIKRTWMLWLPHTPEPDNEFWYGQPAAKPFGMVSGACCWFSKRIVSQQFILTRFFLIFGGWLFGFFLCFDEMISVGEIPKVCNEFPVSNCVRRRRWSWRWSKGSFVLCFGFRI